MLLTTPGLPELFGLSQAARLVTHAPNRCVIYNRVGASLYEMERPRTPSLTSNTAPPGIIRVADQICSRSYASTIDTQA